MKKDDEHPPDSGIYAIIRGEEPQYNKPCSKDKGDALMLNIKKSTRDGIVTFELEGRLDSSTAPGLEAAVSESTAEAKAVVFDFNDLEYLSSAGLRVLLITQQDMIKAGLPDVTIQGANSEVLKIFAATGFDDILNIR